MSTCLSIQDKATSSLLLNESKSCLLLPFCSLQRLSGIYLLAVNNVPVFPSPYAAANQPGVGISIICQCQYDILKMGWYSFSEEYNTGVLLFCNFQYNRTYNTLFCQCIYLWLQVICITINTLTGNKHFLSRFHCIHGTTFLKSTVLHSTTTVILGELWRIHLDLILSIMDFIRASIYS